MPIYDLICSSCGYEQGETIFSSYDAFQKSEKERECPECHERLEAKIVGFNTQGKRVVKTTGGKIQETCLDISLGIAFTPCGKPIPAIGAHFSKKYSKDPEMN